MRFNSDDMKRFLLSLLTLFLTITAFSQNTSPLVVKDFMLQTNGIMDIDQVPKNNRTDWDGNPVCMIQVKAVGFDENLMQKFTFVPNGIDIMHKNIKNGMVILYVSSNKTGDIIIKHMGDCTFTLPHKLEAQKIYVLTLGMESATVIIRTVPSNAEILIDDEIVGTGYASKAVAIGVEHHYKIQCKDYWPKEGQLYFEKRTEKSMKIELEPNFGFITIKTEPAGADVFVDGERVGITPYMSERIPLGQHRIELEKSGYERYAKVVEIKDDGRENTQLDNVKLKAIPNTGGLASTLGIRTFTVKGVTFEMVYVRGGTFTMGGTKEQSVECDNDEKPAHNVTLGDYYIGKMEVTQKLWKAVMGNRPSFWKGDDLPVENISWKDAQEFIKKLNQVTGHIFRLPTEAEWEYAARGGDKSKGYKFSGGNYIGNVAWCGDNSGDKTHSVGSKSPNELGIYDMSGNVYEWCQDWYGDYVDASQNNPTGPSKGRERVLRGGGCYGSQKGCRLSNRYSGKPGDRRNIYGMRLVIVF